MCIFTEKDQISFPTLFPTAPYFIPVLRMPIDYNWIIGPDEIPTNHGGGSYCQEWKTSEVGAPTLPEGTYFLHWGGHNWHWREGNDGYYRWFHRSAHRRIWNQWAQTGGLGIRPNDLPFQHPVTQPPRPTEASTQTIITMRDDPVTTHPEFSAFQLLTDYRKGLYCAQGFPYRSIIQYMGPDTLVTQAPAAPYAPGLEGTAPALGWRQAEVAAIIPNPAASRPLPYDDAARGRSKSRRDHRHRDDRRQLPNVTLPVSGASSSGLTEAQRVASPTPSVVDIPSAGGIPYTHPHTGAKELRNPNNCWKALAIGLDNTKGHCYTRKEILTACALEDNWHKNRAQHLMLYLDDPSAPMTSVRIP